VEGELGTVASLWQEIRELSRSFVSYKISFVFRESNEAAHVCTGLASELNPDVFWLHSFPLCLERVTETDCTPVIPI